MIFFSRVGFTCINSSWLQIQSSEKCYILVLNLLRYSSLMINTYIWQICTVSYCILNEYLQFQCSHSAIHIANIYLTHSVYWVTHCCIPHAWRRGNCSPVLCALTYEKRLQKCYYMLFLQKFPLKVFRAEKSCADLGGTISHFACFVNLYIVKNDEE